MKSRSTSLVLFVAAAGPELGFGHLVRVGRLADALGVRRELVLTGTADTRAIALRFGWTVHDGRDPLAALDPDLVVVDDPSAARAARWVSAAKAAGIPVAVIEDGGASRHRADLTIDGSFASPTAATSTRVSGPMFALLDAGIRARRAERPRRDPHRVLVALGGGAHVGRLGVRLARAIAAAEPGVRVDVAAGFASRQRRPALPARCRWISAPDGLAPQLARAAVAVVAGGVTLYEACALECPTVAVAVVPAQRPAIRAAASHEAVIDGGSAARRGAPAQVAEAVSALLAHRHAAHVLGRRAGRLVDGHGIDRIVRRLARLMGDDRAAGLRHAA